MKTVVIKELGIVAKSFYLQDRELANIGKEKPCITCGQPFKVGEAELKKFRHDPKGKPRKNIEICGVARGSEFFKDVNLNKTPIDLSQYTVTDHAIIFGVEYINQHVCPACTAENATYQDEGAGISNGGGERSHFGSGESESN